MATFTYLLQRIGIEVSTTVYLLNLNYGDFFFFFCTFFMNRDHYS